MIVTDEKKWRFESVSILGFASLPPDFLHWRNASEFPPTISIGPAEREKQYGRLEFKQGVFSFEGDADKSAMVLLEKLNDKWAGTCARVDELECYRERESDLNQVKAVRGWIEVDMCQFCGCTKTLEEIYATSPKALSCCPERRMIKTMVPVGYKDPEPRKL